MYRGWRRLRKLCDTRINKTNFKGDIIAYSYPIWIDVEAYIYKSSKSYGARDTNNEIVKVGTSSKYSHDFVTRRVTRREYDGKVEFRAYNNGIWVSQLILDKKTKEVLTKRDAEIAELK